MSGHLGSDLPSFLGPYCIDEKRYGRKIDRTSRKTRLDRLVRTRFQQMRTFGRPAWTRGNRVGSISLGDRAPVSNAPNRWTDPIRRSIYGFVESVNNVYATERRATKHKVIRLNTQNELSSANKAKIGETNIFALKGRVYDQKMGTISLACLVSRERANWSILRKEWRNLEQGDLRTFFSKIRRLKKWSSYTNLLKNQESIF